MVSMTAGDNARVVRQKHQMHVRSQQGTLRKFKLQKLLQMTLFVAPAVQATRQSRLFRQKLPVQSVT